MTNQPESMLAALDAALSARPTLPADAAAVKLAREYARLIDNAAPNAKYRKALETLTRLMIEQPEKVTEAFRIVVVALAEHSVASDLGPKYLAVLQQLGMTPAGRGAKEGTNDPGPVRANPVTGLRDEVAEQRSKRGAG